MEAYRPPPIADARSEPVIHDIPLKPYPTIDPMNIIGYQFVKNHNGFPHKAKVIEPLEDGSMYIVAEPEFGDLEGHTLILEKALYGLRSSGARWAEKLADSLRRQEFVSSYADPAIWMRDMNDHYEYICVWVDDMLIASKNPKAITDELKKAYTLKGVGPPEYYLGADMERITEPEKVFTMGSGTYIDKCLTIYE